MKEATPPSLFAGMVRSEPLRQGILPSQEIRELINNGKIRSSANVTEDQIQPASIDLRLGRVAYHVEASFLPNRSSTIGAKIKALQLDEIDLSEPALLTKGQVFIIPLVEGLI